MNTIPCFAAQLQEITGKGRYFCAFLFGICLTLAFPPVFIFPALFMAFTGWVWLLEASENKKQAWWLGWWFGFGHHVTGIYWISIALGADGGQFLWMLPLTLCALPAYSALFSGFAGLAFFFTRTLEPVSRVLLLGLFWVISEYGRTLLFYGFPWNLLGYVWTITDVTLQAASVLGVFGMGLWAITLGTSPSLLAHQKKRPVLLIFAVSLAIIVAGALRLHQAPTIVEQQKEATLVRVVQGNIKQSLKWNEAYQYHALQSYMQMSSQPTDSGKAPDYIVWPETAMPFLFESHSSFAKLLATIVPQNGKLITGVVRRDESHIWNSMQVLDAKAGVTAVYDKHVLVPFGEFVPLRPILSTLGVEKITQGMMDFSAGSGARLLPMSDGTAIQPLICYEVIFPFYHPHGKIAPLAPSWIVTITNDAWFGTSSGPYQHLEMARMRAVEQGRPLVRAANTGISAGFDAYGRIINKIPLNKEGVIDMFIPTKQNVSTWHIRLGEKITLLLGIIYILYVVISLRKNT